MVEKIPRATYLPQRWGSYFVTHKPVPTVLKNGIAGLFGPVNAIQRGCQPNSSRVEPSRRSFVNQIPSIALFTDGGEACPFIIPLPGGTNIDNNTLINKSYAIYTGCQSNGKFAIGLIYYVICIKGTVIPDSRNKMHTKSHAHVIIFGINDKLAVSIPKTRKGRFFGIFTRRFNIPVRTRTATQRK